MKFYTKETNDIIEKYFPGAEELTNQRVGSAADYILPDGTIIEVKLDFMASKTGNLYVEYQYTNPKETRSSGLALTAERGYTAVIVILDYKRNIQKILKMPAKDLLSKCIDGKMKSVETGQRANGNREGVKSKGYLFPIKQAPLEWDIILGDLCY